MPYPLVGLRAEDGICGGERCTPKAPKINVTMLGMIASPWTAVLAATATGLYLPGLDLADWDTPVEPEEESSPPLSCNDMQTSRRPFTGCRTTLVTCAGGPPTTLQRHTLPMSRPSPPSIVHMSRRNSLALSTCATTHLLPRVFYVKSMP